jgi:hypothetical protein
MPNVNVGQVHAGVSFLSNTFLQVRAGRGWLQADGRWGLLPLGLHLLSFATDCLAHG